MSGVVARTRRSAWTWAAAWSLTEVDSRQLLIVVIAVSVLVYGHFHAQQLPTTGDTANWDYMAQVIARGGIPYRDAVNIKTPLSAYLGAAAILAAQPFDVRDILAIRSAYMLMATIVVGLTFLVALDYFGSRRVAVLAALIMLGFDKFADWTAMGVEPKTPVLLFGLGSLSAIHHGRPFLAGFFGMLAALSWQPGLLFVGVGLVAFSGYLTRWREPAILKLACGAIIPLLAFIAYFSLVGALNDLYTWTIAFNVSANAPGALRAGEHVFNRGGFLIDDFFSNERWYFILAIAGLAMGLRTTWKSWGASGSAGLREMAPRQAVLIAPLVYLGFCMLNMQGPRDFIPFLPFVATFAAQAIVGLLDGLMLAYGVVSPAAGSPVLKAFGFMLICGLVAALTVADAFNKPPVHPTLPEQDAAIRTLTSHLQPDDTVFVHGPTEILVLTGRTNASKYFYLDSGKDSYLDQVEPGGFDGWLQRLGALQPRAVALSRLRDVKHRRELEAWVRKYYAEAGRYDYPAANRNQSFTYYIRRDAS